MEKVIKETVNLFRIVVPVIVVAMILGVFYEMSTGWVRDMIEDLGLALKLMIPTGVGVLLIALYQLKKQATR